MHPRNVHGLDDRRMMEEVAVEFPKLDRRKRPRPLPELLLHSRHATVLLAKLASRAP
jgi:hypothetical protein